MVPDSVLHKHFGDPAASKATTVTELANSTGTTCRPSSNRVLAMDGADLAAIVDFYGMKMPNAQYLVFCAVHGAHHRGQLSENLRRWAARAVARWQRRRPYKWVHVPVAGALPSAGARFTTPFQPRSSARSRARCFLPDN